MADNTSPANTEPQEKRPTRKRSKNAGVFLIFVGISALFWFILTLNDNVSAGVDVKINITNVPDSVVFIQDPPKILHVNLRDKGTSLLRNGIMRSATLNINFKDYASGGELVFGKNDLMVSLKSTFGSSAQINTIGRDSIYLTYSTAPGKRVPIKIDAKVSPAVGFIAGTPTAATKSVLIYSSDDRIDTIKQVKTKLLTKRGLSETTTMEVEFRSIAGVKIVPSSIKVTIPVEPLVAKTSVVEVQPINIPAGNSVLLYPVNVEVAYYSPLSHFESENDNIIVVADFATSTSPTSDKVGIKLVSSAPYLKNVELKTDSVEYTLVK